MQGQPGALSEKKAGPCALGVSNSIPHFRWWTSVGCDIKVKIAPKSGQVAIVVSMDGVMLPLQLIMLIAKALTLFRRIFSLQSCSMIPNQTKQV